MAIAMAGTGKRKREAPTTRVECDLQLRGPDGEVWLDRTGQYVRFRGSRKWKTTRKLQAFSEGDADLESVETLLCNLIADWDWDDEYGVPLPSPPRPDVLGELEEDEVLWLIAHVPGNEDPKSS